MTRLENWMFQTDRLRRYGGALLAAYLAIFALHIWLRDWPSRANGHPRFVDFVSFWVNARFALTAAAAQAYDYATFAAAQMPLVALDEVDADQRAGRRDGNQHRPVVACAEGQCVVVAQHRKEHGQREIGVVHRA